MAEQAESLEESPSHRMEAEMYDNDEHESTARKVLDEVALAVGEATLDAIRTGALRREAKEYAVREATVLGGKAWTGSLQKVTREVWDFYDINRIAEETKTRLASQLESCAQQLTIGRKDTPTVRGDLGLFVFAIIRRVADESSVECIPAMVDRLILELEGGKLNWSGEAWLSGVTVTEPIQIRKGLAIRPPEDKDLYFERPTNLAEAGLGFTNPLHLPDSVLEVASANHDRPDLRQTIVALSLFRLGVVEITEEYWRSDSVFPYQGGHSLFQSNRNPAFSYTLTKRGAPFLAAFLERLPDDLPKKPLGHHESSQWIALKNYFRALMTASDVEERLGQAVASLESCLLSDDEREELGFKLSLRTASILRFAGFHPASVADDMRKAYGLRSKYSHGAEFKLQHLERAKDLCPRIMNYARLAIIKFIEFPHSRERKELLAKLDLSLLDDEERRKLGEKLSGNLWTYAVEG